jgi:hypothetical protein
MNRLKAIKNRNGETKVAYVLLCLSLAGCSTTLPVVVVEPDGHIFSGSTTAALSGGHFQVTDGHTNCGGTYNALDTSKALTIPVVCSDGRAGRITAVRDPSGQSGFGTVKLSDGSVGRFAFGSRVAELEAMQVAPQVQPSPDRSPRESWNACLRETAARSGGEGSADEIARMLRSRCAGDWEAILTERCASMTPEACAIFRDKMVAVRVEEERKVAAEAVQR